MIVTTWDHRITDVCNLAEIFSLESHYNTIYNESNTLNTLYNIIQSGDADLIVDYTDSILNGAAIVSRSNDFHSEYFGYMNKFYILPDRRLTKAPVRLMREVVKWFDENNCDYAFSSATAGINRDKAFIKLCNRYGFVQDDSGILVRKRNGKISCGCTDF